MNRSLPKMLLLIVIATAVGCGQIDSSKFSWFVRSTPGKGGLTAGIIKTGGNARIDLVIGSGQTKPSAIVVRSATEPSVTNAIWLATQSDSLLRTIGDQTILESPVLPNGKLQFGENWILDIAPDLATVIALKDGLDRILVSAWGNLVVRDRPTGITIWMPNANPRHLPAGSRIEPRGKAYLLTTATGTELLSAPPPPPPENQMAFVTERDAIRFFDPWGKVSAELPSENIEVRGGSQGLLVSGEFPAGLAGISNRPFRVLLPHKSRRLLMINGD